MHLSAAVHLLPACLLAFLISITAHALPADAAREQRLAEYLAQKPMHTTALLAGAAATEVARPAMPTTALRSRVLNQRSSENKAGPIIVSRPDGSQEVLMDDKKVKQLVEEYAFLLHEICCTVILMECRHLRDIELRELKV